MLEAFCKGVDKVNEWVGKGIRLLFIPLIVLVMMEVVLRYVFSRPTIWAWDINIQLMAGFTLLGGGYVLLRNGHVMVDIVTMHLSARARAIMDAATSTLFFFGIGALLWLGIEEAKASVLVRETTYSAWAPPLYPLKIAFCIGCLLLLLQGVVKLIRDLRLATARNLSTMAGREIKP